jgi:heme-degrading monooxygenase HmoA
MIICQFIFKPGTYDEDFYNLDRQIDEYARALPGFVRVEMWFSADQTIKNASYTFETMADVQKLATYPQHLDAKRENARWYDGYRIIISEVTRTYGDGRLEPESP